MEAYEKRKKVLEKFTKKSIDIFLVMRENERRDEDDVDVNDDDRKHERRVLGRGR